VKKFTILIADGNPHVREFLAFVEKKGNSVEHLKKVVFEALIK